MQILVRPQKPKNPKRKKQDLIIGVLVTAIILVSAFIGGMIAHFTGDEDVTTTVPITFEEETTVNVVIEDDLTEEEKEETTEKSTEVVLTLQAPPEVTTKKPSTTKPTQGTTENVATPVKPSEPSGTVQGPITEIIDDGNDSVKEYSCGVSGHHCDSKETHNFIVSLEKKGCPYCNSHSCKSFYTYDEWGNACYDPTKCESYSAKSDPNYYCQECGKKIGDGSKGSCVRFTVDTSCPGCGKKVSAKTCHSH